MLAAILSAAACSSLPRAGPSTDEVVERFEKGPNPLGVRIVNISPDVVQALQEAPRDSLADLNRLRSPRAVDRIGPGDVISVSIYEAGPGLFTPATRQATGGDTSGSTAETLPRLQVDQAGRVEIPFAGLLTVAGHTTTEVGHMIEDRLAEKAVQPQVIVSIVSGDTNSVIVGGDVKTPGRRALTLSGENLLDVIALSGGPSHDPPDTMVRVIRGRATGLVALTRLQEDPTENIRMQPQDRVQVVFAPRSFLVFGATGRVAQTPFEATRVSLAEALARSGGLDDNRANPASVFLFRQEPAGVAAKLGLPPPNGASVPVVYRADLRDPQNFFLLQQIAMEDKDLIYVANAGTVQVYKFLQLIFTVIQPAANVRTLSGS
jgi:polysaccharide export outer membrane protein